MMNDGEMDFDSSGKIWGDAVKLHAHVTGNKGNSGNATMQCIHCTIMVIALAKHR